jgi:hypothetical protein
MKKNRLILIISSVAFLSLIPLIAMQFTDEVHWTLFHFLVAAVLLLVTGLIIDIITRKITNPGYWIILSVLMVVLLLLIWAELAVGIFGTPLGGQ